jgi:hypothetical protein
MGGSAVGVMFRNRIEWARLGRVVDPTWCLQRVIIRFGQRGTWFHCSDGQAGGCCSCSSLSQRVEVDRVVRSTPATKIRSCIHAAAHSARRHVLWVCMWMLMWTVFLEAGARVFGCVLDCGTWDMVAACDGCRQSRRQTSTHLFSWMAMAMAIAGCIINCSDLAASADLSARNTACPRTRARRSSVLAWRLSQDGRRVMGCPITCRALFAT